MVIRRAVGALVLTGLMVSVGCGSPDPTLADVISDSAAESAVDVTSDSVHADAALDGTSGDATSVSDASDVTIDAGTCPARGSGDRALWVWQQSTATNATERDAFFAFAASHHVRSVYLAAYDIVTDRPTDLETFLVAARDRCIEVELLFGDATWVTNHAPAIAIAQAAVHFAASSSAPPTALHFDVEPHSLPGWDTNIQSYATQYLDLLAQLRTALGSSPLALRVDIAFWYDGTMVARNSMTRPLSQWVIDAVDRAVLMDYRDYVTVSASTGATDGIVPNAMNEIVYADTVHHEIAIGLETNAIAGYPQTTFYEEGAAALESAITQTDTTYTAHVSYRGMAVHDLVGYRALRP